MGVPHEATILIRESHLDTFGHVNNATYLELYEQARWDLITERGFGIQTIRETGTGPVILEVDLKFRRELKNRERVRIVTELVSRSTKIGKLLQRMINERGEVASEALFTVGLMDQSTRRLIPLSGAFLRAMGAGEEAALEQGAEKAPCP